MSKNSKSSASSEKTSILNSIERKVVILRGESGSGKSTYIRKNCSSATVCSADDFFTEVVGEGKGYVFDPKRLGEAHRWCMQKFINATTHRDPIGRAAFVVVDNTNTMLWEFMGYVQVAQAMGYTVQIVRMDTPLEVCAQRNVHGVPAQKVRDMARRFQNIPPWLGLEEKRVKGI